MVRTNPEESQLWQEFHALVNMPSPDLRNWLNSAPDDPDRYLYDPDVDVRELGPKILHLLEKRRTDLTAQDDEVMAVVLDVVPAWLADPRDDDRWRHSLMSLGHDPLKPESPRGDEALALRRTTTDV